MYKQQPHPDPDVLRQDHNHYGISETFYSTQGEGVLAGVPMVFIRFASCNLRCSRSNAGFDCDTDFVSARQMTCEAIVSEARSLSPAAQWVLLTGGEPTLQVDARLVTALRDAGFKVAMESNGTIALRGYEVDHLTISPKSAWHTLHQRTCHELRVVRAARQALPTAQQVREELRLDAAALVVSPAFLAGDRIDPEALAWCERLVLHQPEWRLSVQLHKLKGVR